MTLSSAYLLVFHGSRDIRSRSAASDLVRLLTVEFQSNTILNQPNYLETKLSFSEPKTLTTAPSSKLPLVEVAALELAELSLSESLVNFAHKAIQKGLREIKVLPLFLAPGVHVQEDVPQEIALAIKQINNNQVTIELSPFLGKYSGIIPLLSRKFWQLSAQTRILTAHGSRSVAANDYYEHLANQLNAVMSYWSTHPSLRQQVIAQIAAGKKKIAIVPYFLFPGKITQAIAQEVAKLQTEYPQVELILGQPLGATPALAKLIFEEVEQR